MPIITGIREQIAFLLPGCRVHPHGVDVGGLVEKPVETNLLLDRAEAQLKAAEPKWWKPSRTLSLKVVAGWRVPSTAQLTRPRTKWVEPQDRMEELDGDKTSV
ncbi:MAG: hypothetical protein ABSB61_08485 [Anaerolineales bacterium]